MKNKFRLIQTSTVGNVTFINESARQYHLAKTAANRPLQLVTCPELLGKGSTVMTEEALEIITSAAAGLGVLVRTQAIEIEDALILCDLPMTAEDILALVFPADVVAQ